MGPLRRLRTRVGLVLPLVLSAGIVQAQPRAPASEDAKRLAREAYVRGEAALARDEFGAATAEFTYADEIAPNDAPLQAALDAVAHTNDLRKVVVLLNRSERRGTVGPSVTAAAKRVREKFGPSIGRIVIECPAGATCNAELDKAAVVPGVVSWIVPGTHWVRASVNGAAFTEDGIDVKAGGLSAIPLKAASTSRALITEVPEQGPVDSSGPSPMYFWIGLGVTAVLIGVSTASMIDSYWKSNDVKESCGETSTNNACPRLMDEADGAEKRTFVLWGVTGAFAVATAVTGLFIVKWRNGSAAVGSPPSAGLLPRGAGLRLEQRF
jgi:hypothetical protein